MALADITDHWPSPAVHKSLNSAELMGAVMASLRKTADSLNKDAWMFETERERGADGELRLLR